LNSIAFFIHPLMQAYDLSSSSSTEKLARCGRTHVLILAVCLASLLIPSARSVTFSENCFVLRICNYPQSDWNSQGLLHRILRTYNPNFVTFWAF
jgi:hypothetical protein